MEMKRSIFNLSAAALITAMSLTPVMAAGATYAAVAGKKTTFTKTINMSSTASVPNVTFSYAVAKGTAQAASTGNLAVYAGNDGVTSTGNPTIANITFSASDPKTSGTTIVKTGTVDFSKVSFKEPGVYRWLVTESGSTQGLSTTEDQTKAIDVYVTDDAGKLVVSGYVMHDNETAAAEQLSATKRLGDKDTDFAHTLTTSDLTLSKAVTGNQGSHDEYFKFTVKISGAVAGTKFNVDLTNADATTKTNGINTTTHTNASSITAGTDGTVTAEYWLQNSQSIKICGLAASTGYDITEANGSYVTTIAVTGDTDGATTATPNVKDSAMTKDTTVAYTNNKQGAVPTGVFMSIGGSAAVTLLAGTGIAIHFKKKKEEDAE